MICVFRGSLFNQWISDLPRLVKRATTVQKTLMTEEKKKKELKYLWNRRQKVIEELRNEYYKATNHGVLLTRPVVFPWINKYIKSANNIMSKYPKGALYLDPLAQEFISLSFNQAKIAQLEKNTAVEVEWTNLAYTLRELRRKIFDVSKRSEIQEETNPNNTNKSKVKFEDAKAFNQKYFRPSNLPALNTRNLDRFIISIHDKDPTKVTVPDELMSTPINTIINYYSILREANTLPIGAAGCGTIGMLKAPYPIAYNFLSTNYKNKINYDDYIKSFKTISHINLIKLIKENSSNDSQNNKLKYFIELEFISPPGVFEYYFGGIDIIKEDGTFKIDNIRILPEDYFCAPYHYWQHNAEMKVNAMYGNWCKLISLLYPTVESDYMKHIYFTGTDGNNYLFKFMKLTNGTDTEIGQFKLSDSGQWVPININPYKCVE